MTHPKKSRIPFAPLEHPCRHLFPFVLACPSFVYPAGYADNVRLLAGFVDEIQLLFFESRPTKRLPSTRLIRELANLADTADITYNVHLPADIFLGHPDPLERRRSTDALQQILDRCGPLAPSTFTLHLNRNPDDIKRVPVSTWQELMTDSLAKILRRFPESRRISVETLDYPFAQVAPVVTGLDLSVCMDMGHLMVHGVDLFDFFAVWEPRITIIHLHGVDQARDHLPLNRLSQLHMDKVLAILRTFSGVVSLEVYSQPALDASLAHLRDQWRQTAGP
ncbi:cobamide remodeling phosphodiesterase CbiR [Desulfosarcina sp.]|uniref:cobamide remodeling phosphodiesterase CbiR n=1 Tax=Desulfosarcina sp. TaxID=2027861 RepID=UPI003970E97D